MASKRVNTTAALSKLPTRTQASNTGMATSISPETAKAVLLDFGGSRLGSSIVVRSSGVTKGSIALIL